MRVLVLASIGLFMAFVDLTIVNVALPDIAGSFPDTGISALSWVLSGYSIVSAAFLVPFGRLADIVGRKRVYVCALGAFTATSSLCALAPSAGVPVAARILQGLAAAALVPAGYSLVMAAFGVERRLAAVSISAAVGALAGGIGPALGGLLVSAAGWRLVFLVNLPVGIAAAVVCARSLPESRGGRPRAFPDVLGAALFALAVAALAFAIAEGDGWEWSSARVRAIALAAVGIGAFARRSRRRPEPLFDPSVVRVRAFMVATVAHATSMAGFFGYTLCNVLFLTSVWGYSPLETGAALSPGPVVAFVVAVGTSRMLRRIGARPLLVPGGILWAAAVWWLALHAGPQPEFLGLWLPVVLAAGVGAGLVVSHGASAAINAAPGDRFATACGLQQVGRALGAALGVAAAAAIIGTPSVETARDGWLFGAACLAAGSVGSLWITGVRRSPAVLRTSPKEAHA